MVRLLLTNPPVSKPATLTFNPTMVRLLRASLSPSLTKISTFQSHNGAIAAAGNHGRSGKNAAFNPTMVRLLPPPPATCKFRIVIFQSHNGAIAAQAPMFFKASPIFLSIPQWCDCCTSTLDNSNGLNLLSIPQWCDCCHPLLLWHILAANTFNPTMVRLLRKEEPNLRAWWFDFQSHNGAIAAPGVGMAWATGFRSFNPTMVRLLRGTEV